MKTTILALSALALGAVGIWYSLQTTDRAACYSTPGPVGPFTAIPEQECVALVKKVSTSGITSLTATYDGNPIISTGESLSPETGFRFTEHLRIAKMQTRMKGTGSKILMALAVVLVLLGLGLLFHRMRRALTH